jgi:hypothetical protein
VISIKELAQETINVLIRLSNYGGLELTNKDIQILSSTDLEVMEKTSDRLIQIDQAVTKGFYYCAGNGDILYPKERVIDLFGRSIEANYPEASMDFIRFAWGYWTLKALVIDMRVEFIAFIGQGILSKLENDIAAVFFPTPGPHRIDPRKREAFQRELLNQYPSNINIENFIKGNPILIRDRSASSGCITIVLAVSVIVPLAIYYLT